MWEAELLASGHREMQKVCPSSSGILKHTRVKKSLDSVMTFCCGYVTWQDGSKNFAKCLPCLPAPWWLLIYQAMHLTSTMLCWSCFSSLFYLSSPSPQLYSSPSNMPKTSLNVYNLFLSLHLLPASLNSFSIHLHLLSFQSGHVFQLLLKLLLMHVPEAKTSGTF